MPLTQDIKDLIEHDNSGARRLLHRAVEEMPQSVEARFFLAQAYLRRMEVTTALPLYMAVAEHQERAVDALHAVGYCHLALGDYESALAAYRRAFAKTATAHSLGLSALVLHRMNRLGEAIAAYDKLLRSAKKASPTIPAALQGMVMALRDAGRAVEAEPYVADLLARFRAGGAAIAMPLIDRNGALDFHEWWPLEDKSNLAQAVNRFAACEAENPLVPETFILPRQRDALARFASKDPGTIFIVKPNNGTGGQGITVTRDLAALIDRRDVVVQRYVDHPYLIDGRKGHARIYGLIASADPLRAYVYEEGIVRFAPARYDPRSDHLGDNAMHVTNTALHRGHPGLIVSQDSAREDEGVIWSLSAALRRMTQDGVDGVEVFAKIVKLVRWFVRMVASEGLFARQAKSAPRRAFTPKLFGLDVLIDAKGDPWLIEMQVKPAAGGAPLVMKINGELFATVLRMSVGHLFDPAKGALTALGEAECLRREYAVETTNRGRFRPLDFG